MKEKYIGGRYYKLAGKFGVDAGLCWIGDPCYVLHKDKTDPRLGRDWDEFCGLIGDDDTKELSLGVCVSTGYGDGEYPVYVETQNGRIASVFIDFMGRIDDDEED